MNLKQIIDLAKGGELRQVAVENGDKGIVGFTNLALIELYKRFPIRIDEAIITLDTSSSGIYSIVEGDNVALNGGGEFMYIIAAYGEVEAGGSVLTNVLPVNEEDNPVSINMVGWNQIQVPLNTDGARISLIYAAAPDYIIATYNVDNTLATASEVINVPIPPQMVEALLHYIGYRAHASVNGEINAENSTHYTRFEGSCARIKQLGLFTGDDLSMRNRIFTRGMV